MAEEESKDREVSRKLKQEKSKERKARRDEEIATRKRLAGVRQAMASRPQGLAVDTGTSLPLGTKRARVFQDEQLVAEYMSDPTVSATALAVKFGVSRAAIEQRRNRLAEQGVIQLLKDERGRVVSVSTMQIVVAVGEGMG